MVKPSMIGSAIRGNRTGSEHDLRLDDYLPSFDVTQRRHIVVDATPDEAYEAVRHVNLMRIGLGPRLLGELRYLPERLLARIRGVDPPEMPESLTIDDLADESEYVVLAESPGAEFVLGAVGRFWQPAIEWVEIDPGEFASFDRPGYAKLAIGISVVPYGSNRSLITYEARTATTDAPARRRFRLYWALIGPFAGYLMGRVLETAKATLRHRTIEIET